MLEHREEIVQRLFVMTAALLALAMGGACASGDGSGIEGSVSPSKAACIDKAEVETQVTSLSGHIQSAVDELQQLHFDGGVSELRLASSDIRQLGDKVSPIDQNAADLLSRAADEIDSAATTLNDGDIGNATSYLKQAVNDIGGISTAVADSYCDAA